MSSQDGSKSDLLVSNKPLTNRFDTTERNAMSRSPVCISRPGSPAGATSATEWQVEVGCERPLNLKCTGSPGSSGSGFSSAGVDGNSNTLVKNISDDSNAHTSQGMADLSTNATFSVNTTQLMDIGDSILHEISGVSGLHDTLASQSDPGCPAHKCSGHHARSGALESSTLSLSLDRLPRVLSSSRNSQVTLLEDIGDSILNYSNGTDAEEDVERLNSRQAQDQEEVEANVCANNVIQDKSLDPRGQDIPEVESGQTDIEIIINKWDEEVELISERDEHAPKCEETTTDIDQQSLNGDCEDHVKLNKLEEKPRENAIYDSFDKLVDECKSDLLRQYKRRGSAQGTAIQPPEVFRISARCFSAPSLKNAESPVAFSVQSREHSFDPGREEALSQIAPLLLTALPHASPQTINNFTLSHCELECAVGEPAEKTPCSSVYPDTLLQSSPEGQIQLKKSTQDQDNLSTSSTSSDPQHNSNDGREDEATNTRLNDQNHNLIVCENEFLGHNFGTFQGKIGPNSSSNENSIQENDYHSFSSNDENRNGEKREYVDGVIRQISSTTNQANGHKGEGDFSEQCIGTSKHISGASEEKEGVSLTSDESEYYDSPCKDVCIHSELFCVKHEESGETGDCSEIYSKESEQPSVSSEENRQTSVLSKHIIKGSDNTSISHDESEGGEFNASDVNGKVYNEENEQISTFSERSEDASAFNVMSEELDEIVKKCKESDQTRTDCNENDKNKDIEKVKRVTCNFGAREHVPVAPDEAMTIVSSNSHADCENKEPFTENSSIVSQHREQILVGSLEKEIIDYSCQESDQIDVSRQAEQKVNSVNLVREQILTTDATHDKNENMNNLSVDYASRSHMELDQTVLLTHYPHTLEVDSHENRPRNRINQETESCNSIRDMRKNAVIGTVENNQGNHIEVISKSIIENEANCLDNKSDTDNSTSRSHEIEDAENTCEDESLCSTVEIGFTHPAATQNLHNIKEYVNESSSFTTAKDSDREKEGMPSQGVFPETPVTELTRNMPKVMQSTPDIEETTFVNVEYSGIQSELYIGKENGLDLKTYDASPPREENVQLPGESLGINTHVHEDGHGEEALMSSLGEEEVFAGLGTSDTFSSLSDSASPSPLPPPSSPSPTAEEDLVDALFHACDTSGCGRVPAAQIAAHLAVILSDLQPRWLVESLKDVLCTDGEENQLDISTYRGLLTTWLQDHAKDVNILNNHNTDADAEGDAGADTSCDEVTNIFASPKPDLSEQETKTPVNVVTPTRSSNTLCDLASDQTAAYAHNATPLFVPTPVNRTQDSFAWCGNLRDPGDGGEMGRTPPRRQLLYEDRLRQCIEGQLSSGNRRSTLLPWLRPPGSSGPVPGDTLVMSRPPSPISPAPSFIFNQNAKNNNNIDNASFRGTGEKANHVPQLADHSGLNYTFGSLEDEAGTHRPDPGELQQEVLELEHTNRRLTGENAELTTHLTHAEDLNTSLREQCRQLEQALNSVQHQLAGARRMETEIEEFRNLLDVEREEKGRLLGRLGHLEKDNQELAARLEGLVAQVNAAHEEAEGRATREAQLVAEHKTQVATLMEKLSSWKFQAQSQGSIVRDLEDTVKDLKRVIEALKDEKTNLEQQLTCLREELTSVTTQADHEISSEVDEDVKETRSSGNIMGSLKKMPWGPPLYSTPFSGRSLAKSSQETPQSIHSEIHTMGENNGSLPFCEKSEDAVCSLSHNQGDNDNLQCSANNYAADSSTALLSSMLKWWRLWEEQGVTLLLGVQGRDASALHDHFASHHDELLKIENKLQGIIKKKTQTQTPHSSGRSSLSGVLGRSRSSSREPSSTRSSLSRPRTPGSHVSQLISKFETASPSTSPVPSELSERLSRLVDYNSNVSKEVDRTGQCSPTSSVDSSSRKSPVIFKNMRECKIQRKQKSFEAELCLEEINISEGVSEEETDDIPKDVYAKARNYDSASPADNQNVTQENRLVDTEGEQVVESDGVLLKIGLDAEDETVKELSEDINEKDEVVDVQFEGIRSEGVFRNGITVEVDLESDIYVENSQLMRLMKEVKEQKLLIEDLRCQLCVAEEEKETHTTYLSRIHRLLLSVTSETYRWTEGVRKEWLSRVPGVSEEGAADPLRSTEPLDDGPLTGTHSREEIESLIRARCDLGCPPSKDDLAKEYVNPENLAAELERELLALKLHVARSHALLHHYQSSSLYGSRSEVSTPPAPPLRQTQGVEAGVECDLCGPTCVPRPSGSTATQTPASPTPASLSPTTPATPECEESAPTSTLWEADEDVADSDHASFTPQHRPLYQKIVVPEEEEEEEEVVAGVGEEDMAVSSDHALYAPKPTYDQLDQYRPPSKRSGDEKLRRTGLATIAPQKGGSSDSDDERELPTSRSPQIRLRQLTKRSHSDPEVTPLSPPPSLYTEEEEEEEPRLKKGHVAEQEPVLPSTPESGSSNSSANPFRGIGEKANLGGRDDADEKTPCEDDAGAGVSGAAEDEVDSQQEEGQCSGGVFPSLPDNYLRSIGLARDDHSPTENLSAQEIEGKFKQLSLAFNTDRLTLRQRLDVQQRQRDTAENNFETEFNLLRSAVLALHADCLDTELVDNVTQVRRQLDVLITTSTRLVSASELEDDKDAPAYASDDDSIKEKVWGAVQQEWRVSRALEVLLLHVENVKRLYERDHQELEEMRKLLAEYQIDMPNSSGNSSNSNTQSSADNPTTGVRLRTFSFAVGGKQQSQETRRISLTTGTTHAALSAFLGTKSSKRRASLMPDIRPFQESKASIAAVAAAAAAAAASSRASISAASKDKTEKNGQASNGVFSITEEGSESGGEGSDTPPLSSSGTPTALAISRTLAQLHPDLYSAVPPTQEATRRLSEDDSSGSITQSMAADSTVATTLAPNPETGPQHWLMVGLEDVIGWIRGGRWPYSSQQTVLGARYAFTSLLLLLAAFFLLLTISSSDQQVPQPYHPGWTSITHVLHPFVTLRYVGTPPT